MSFDLLSFSPNSLYLNLITFSFWGGFIVGNSAEDGRLYFIGYCWLETYKSLSSWSQLSAVCYDQSNKLFVSDTRKK